MLSSGLMGKISKSHHHLTGAPRLGDTFSELTDPSVGISAPKQLALVQDSGAELSTGGVVTPLPPKHGG